MAKAPPKLNVPSVSEIAETILNGNENDGNDGNSDNGSREGSANGDSSSVTASGNNDSADSGETGSATGTGGGTVAGNNATGGISTDASNNGDGHSANETGTGTGTGSGSGQRRRGRPVGSRNKTSGEQTETRILEETTTRRAPRKVKDTSAPDDELANVPTSTRDLIANVYSGLYWSAGQLTSLPSVWELNDSQEEALTNATEAMIKSLGKRKASRTLKAINEYFPGVSLVITALVITVPRIQITAKVKNVHNQQANARRSNGGQGPATNGGVDTTSETVAVDDGSSDTGIAGFRARPLTASDFTEIGDRPFS